ncbi:hypothetical protein BH18THE1_BH18THE1_22630 [soil metagenome]
MNQIKYIFRLIIGFKNYRRMQQAFKTVLKVIIVLILVIAGISGLHNKLEN